MGVGGGGNHKPKLVLKKKKNQHWNRDISFRVICFWSKVIMPAKQNPIMWPSSNIAKVSLQIPSANIYTWNINTTRAKRLTKFVCYIEVSLNQGFLPFFHTFYYYWAKESHLLYQGLRWSFVILRFHWGSTVIHNPWPSRDNYTEKSQQPPKTTNQNCLTPGPSCSQPPFFNIKLIHN